MLAKPEVGTKEHVMLWLASKPRDARFTWFLCCECACGLYIREHGLGDRYDPDAPEHEKFEWLNQAAYRQYREDVDRENNKLAPSTLGDLYDSLA